MTNREQLFEYAMNFKSDKENILDANADILVYLFDNCEFEFLPDNRFFVNVNCGGLMSYVAKHRNNEATEKIKALGLDKGDITKSFTGIMDYGHTSAGWEDVINLGIYGLRERAVTCLNKPDNDEAAINFYKNIIRVYDASFRFVKRVIASAKENGRDEMAHSLSNLLIAPPKNLYEAMQTSIVFYIFQNKFDDSPLRTLGRIDSLFYPFYVKEEKTKADELVTDYMRSIDSYHVGSNIPFALGGRDKEGKNLINELSYKILRAYHKVDVKDTKFHMIVSENTPEDIVAETLDGVRRGKNSVVFISDEKVTESLIFNGAEKNDAINFHIVGCYECGAEGELTCSCNARVNIPKALEYALFQGKDIICDIECAGLKNNGKFDTYDELYEEFVRQLRYLSKCAMDSTDIYEELNPKTFSAAFLSSSYKSAMEKGRDLHNGFGAKYNNSSVNAIGLATATDSLYAIKKLVFEDRELTLDELKDILRSNWKGYEALRYRIINKIPKYGQDNDEVDSIAKNIVNVLSDEISNKPNKKTGVYRLGTFSIDWRHKFGEKTLASADGRFTGEAISQNASATFGRDKFGATSHILSASKLDGSKTPNGTVVDIDFHSSAVSGKEGLQSMMATLKTYFDRGGFAVHFNVLDTDVLEDAKEHPEKYPNLQVRLCGWNVLFANLSDKEKDEFIYRSQR